MRKKEDGYYRGSSCKYKLIAHIVFVTKFRYKILYGKLDNDLKKIMLDLANENDWYIQILETDIDNIHILLDYHQTDSISNIVKILKQQSTYRIWQLHPELRKTYFGARNLFWSSGYFACSIGDASNETIKKHIENQG